MADDPNRDILSAKDGSCVDSILNAIDPRERHLVCKLDRYQLEDKYLRLLDEVSNLKKLSNCQEDKIKKLGTKLIRLAGTPRSSGLTLDIADDRNKTSTLELENTKLKEKITVMRNQLLSHTMSGRSSSRSRNLARPTSSGLMTCRSDNNRARAPSCQCIVETGRDDSDARNYLVKIEKLEAQKKDMACRIAELEKELALYATSSQREKVAENVEYIRVWRQMKQLNDKLITAHDKNAALTTEINDLKTTLEQTTRNNQEIAAVLTSERARISEIDDQMLKAKNSQLILREKDEQIRDLMNEMKILQQHNNELIALTSKYGQVELENVELRKKLSVHIHEQQTLRIAFNNEQANITALQATNEQLLAKLQDLQTNIDNLTVQLMTLHKQKDDKNNATKIISSDVPILNGTTMISSNLTKEEQNNASNLEKQTITLVEQCKKCCEMYDKVIQLEKIIGNTREDWQSADKSVQTITVAADTREQSTMTLAEDEDRAYSQLQSPLKEGNSTNILSREKILKLLDQAQINTPLDSSRIARNEEYRNILDVAQRHSDGEVSSRTLYDESNSIQKKPASLESPNVTSSRILLILLNVLQVLSSNVGDRASKQVSTNGNSLTDINNNLTSKTTRDIEQNDLNGNIVKNDNNAINNEDRVANTNDYINEDEKMSACNCDMKRCPIILESNCCMNYVPPTVDRAKLVCEEESASVSTKDVCLSTIKTVDVPTITPVSTVYEKCRKSSYRDISNDFCAEKTAKRLKISVSPRQPRCNLTCHLRKVKDLPSKQEKRKLPCKIECLNDSVELPVCSTESFPLLITDRQGLIEIHILRLQLSTSAAKIPEEEDICNLYIYISWDIWDEKTAYTPRMKYPDLNFNSSSVYRIVDLFSFFKNVLSEYLVFRVNIVRLNDTSYTFARAKVSIKDILDYPQNKLHYIVPVSSVISCFFGVNFGQLSLWVRLSCNVDMVEAFKKQCGIASLRDALHAPRIQKDTIVEKAPEIHTVAPAKPDTIVSEKRDEEKDLKNSIIRTSIDSNHETEDSDDEMYYSNNQEFSPINEISEKENGDIDKKKKCPDSGVLLNDKKRGEADNAFTETASKAEFRTLLTNAERDVPLLDGSNSTIHDMNEVLSERNWERYRQKSLRTSATIRANLNVGAQDYRSDAATRVRDCFVNYA